MPSLHYTPVDKKANSLLQRDCMTNTLITVVVKGSRYPKLLVVHEEKEFPNPLFCDNQLTINTITLKLIVFVIIRNKSILFHILSSIHNVNYHRWDIAVSKLQ